MLGTGAYATAHIEIKNTYCAQHLLNFRIMLDPGKGAIEI